MEWFLYDKDLWHEGVNIDKAFQKKAFIEHSMLIF